MKRIVLFVFALTVFGTGGAFAQQSFGYGFIGGTFGGGRGGVGGAFRYGIGGEGRVAPLVTMGGEIGGIAKNGNGGIGSGNISFHLPIELRRLDPFLTAGFSIGHKNDNTGLWANVGGGVHYWMLPRIGLRAELRGYPGGYDLSGFGEFRFGVVFR